MKWQFSNRASALTIATLAVDGTSLSLEAGAGAKMPVLGAGDKFRAALIAVDGSVELVDGIAVVGDVVTLERAREGTAAQTFAAGSRFEVRMTAAIARIFIQRQGDAMAGPLDMAGNAITNATFSGPQVFDTIHANFVRSAAIPKDQPFNGPAENSINIPPNTNPTIELRRPRYMGRPICNAQMFDGVCFDWYGDVNNVPAHLRLCNGSNGTPDLRNVFIRGWSDTFGVGATGGTEFPLTTPAGGHSHGGGTIGIALTIDQIPPHAHPVPEIAGSGGTEGTDARLGRGIRNTDLVGGGQPHAHPIVSEADHQHFNSTIPPFFALAKVMFNV